MSSLSEPVLNIIVVGFHHKKGCQVEHCYPELVPGNPTELPLAWRHLPALALPDGSHNYMSDTIFFHLPGLTEPAHTVFAISCFRQIPIEQVVQKTEDMTRSSVQKSVCVVCRWPLFGRLAIKMDLVVRAWFLQGDFTQFNLLEDAYRHLNSCPVQLDQTLEVGCVVEWWRHKCLLLVKLVLLRRRVLVAGARAGELSRAVLALLSLLPRCLPEGLRLAANSSLSRPLSPLPLPSDEDKEEIDAAVEPIEPFPNGDEVDDILSPKETGNLIEEKDTCRRSFDENLLADTDEKQEVPREKCNSVGEKYKQQQFLEAQQSPTMARDMSVDGLFNLASQIDLKDCGFPLRLFEDGYLCLPYLSLQYLELLAEQAGAGAGCIVGASNVLFTQKRHLFDVVVTVSECRVEAREPALRRQLALGTEDLRFADRVLRHAARGDDWLREQFATYLVHLLRTSLLPEGSREIEPFNAAFMTAFKATPAYEKWLSETNGGEAIAGLPPGHPFAGQLSVNDMKLKLAHTMSTTEGGRKVTAAVASTGRAVATTSRAVGGALSQARGALSGWWSALTAPPTANTADADVPPSDAEDATEDLEKEKQIEKKQELPDPPDKEIQESNSLSGKISVV